MTPALFGLRVSVPRRSFSLIVCLSILIAGCASLVDGEQNETDDPPPGEERVEDCIAQSFEGNESRDSGQAAYLECRANVPGHDQAGIECPDASSASVTVQTNLTDGQVRLVVTDGREETILDRRFGDTGGEPRNVSMDTSDALPGEWTFAGERDEAFDGTYRAELFCSYD